MQEAVLDVAEIIASDAVAAARHAGRVTVKGKDIKIACR
jgi:histone H3/H4